jgi:ubiquinone/menaquinone biosynthesis C-methylase UbiE
VSYILESVDETRRLLAQERASDVRHILQLTGLKAGDRALDAGCGPGGILEVIAEQVGPGGRAVGLDLSEERLEEARRLLSGRGNVSLMRADVRSTGLGEGEFDYTWSQYVLEYLPDRQKALAELVRVTRPGGKVVVSEIDGQGLNNWPFEERLRVSAEKFLRAMGRTGFDVFVGRKLYSEFRQAGLKEVRVHLFPQYVIAGVADARMMADWETRFSALESLVAQELGGLEAYRELSREYLRMLADPEALKYSVLLVTEGTRP